MSTGQRWSVGLGVVTEGGISRGLGLQARALHLSWRVGAQGRAVLVDRGG